MHLKEWIWINGVTYQKLSSDLAINMGYLHHIASGKQRPSAMVALQIEDYTGGEVSRDEVIFPEKHPNWDTIKNKDYRSMSSEQRKERKCENKH
jgi:DNA-binding transcriptional regulator YdaS (Cro superfamily)